MQEYYPVHPVHAHSSRDLGTATADRNLAVVKMDTKLDQITVRFQPNSNRNPTVIRQCRYP